MAWECRQSSAPVATCLSVSKVHISQGPGQGDRDGRPAVVLHPDCAWPLGSLLPTSLWPCILTTRGPSQPGEVPDLLPVFHWVSFLCHMTQGWSSLWLTCSCTWLCCTRWCPGASCLGLCLGRGSHISKPTYPMFWCCASGSCLAWPSWLPQTLTHLGLPTTCSVGKGTRQSQYGNPCSLIEPRIVT